MSALLRFHDHLDECERCREQPFNLCGARLKLLLAAGDESARPVFLTRFPDEPPSPHVHTPECEGEDHATIPGADTTNGCNEEG